MSSPNSLTVESGSNERWKFLRDVVVFQLKMFLDNVRDFALMPVSLVAALIDLIFKGKGHGSLFYQVLRWGAHSEEVINVYSAIEAHERPRMNPNYTVDAMIARLRACWCGNVRKVGPPRVSKPRWTGRSIKSKSKRAGHATERGKRWCEWRRNSAASSTPRGPIAIPRASPPLSSVHVCLRPH